MSEPRQFANLRSGLVSEDGATSGGTRTPKLASAAPALPMPGGHVEQREGSQAREAAAGPAPAPEPAPGKRPASNASMKPKCRRSRMCMG